MGSVPNQAATDPNTAMAVMACKSGVEGCIPCCTAFVYTAIPRRSEVFHCCGFQPASFLSKQTKLCMLHTTVAWHQWAHAVHQLVEDVFHVSVKLS
jgi:hypothetical protein